MMSSSRPEEITQSLPIPEEKIGWIVGKKGSFINYLSKKSHAMITISETSSKEYGLVWKYVQLTGTGRAVDRAKKLIHIRLELLDQKNTSSNEQENNESMEVIPAEDQEEEENKS